ncbi:hypothetical protein K8O68_02000 [Salipaludibacillus sp. CUR1]|uniref:Uncharacterized protein n=1 Tax=Salipaludibacillus aurantiacus TaxID=1601833 RepID=A0A1H9WDX7_9BACI|nr:MULTISPECIES: hypothetical protein [Salipaludibacillus]MCE7791190.1 hypothetical protein [Salipaludibacillus sp. CUR1]SES32136.1 hypothetical protein SAMN05518684_11663 [Salipaludibacillus aurantiacus]
MLKQFFSIGFLALVLFLTPVTHVFAEENGDNGASLLEGPFVIVAFATIILMIYYAIRD